ncbi:hypothetical protein AK812_SmicGene7327 [Symbiodinium microadriaticum]|uniref:Uncharacterized protein n=1 Tax=Symbiodinium microadriaticum TaxID=2951 RepID=A0A1Q9EP60_SYMMI|nr:hypothetical protein AK812_SmicGene7327 [Symbiodinium microadriaticum]
MAILLEKLQTEEVDKETLVKFKNWLLSRESEGEGEPAKAEGEPAKAEGEPAKAEAVASLNKAVTFLGFLLASLNKADQKQSSLKKAMVLAGLLFVQPAMAAVGLPWRRVRFHQRHKCYVLLGETGHQWRPLTEDEDVSLRRALQLSPAMARYLLESGWQVRDLQKPYWSPGGQTWQLPKTQFPAEPVAVGAKPKARSRAASRAASSNRAKSWNRAKSSNRAKSQVRAKKEESSQEQNYSYTYYTPTEEAEKPEQGRGREAREVKVECTSQQWQREEHDDGRVRTWSREETWQPAASSSSSSWQQQDSQQWQDDSQQWQDDSQQWQIQQSQQWFPSNYWTDWTEWQDDSQQWQDDNPQAWDDNRWWANRWEGATKSEQDDGQGWVKSEQDNDDGEDSSEESSSWRRASRGYLSSCRLERRKLQREGKPVPSHLQPRQKKWLTRSQENARKWLQKQLQVLEEKLEESMP